MEENISQGTPDQPAPQPAAPDNAAAQPAAAPSLAGAAANGAPANSSYSASLQGPSPMPASSDSRSPEVPPSASGAPAPSGEAPADPNAQPISDWGKVDLELGDALVDGALVESFGQAAVEARLTPAQARAVAQAYTKTIQAQAASKVEAERKILEKAWGSHMAANMREVENLCQRLARVPGCENFRDAMIESGASANAKVILAFHALAKSLAEDSRGRIAGGAPLGKETALDGIRAAFGLS